MEPGRINFFSETNFKLENKEVFFKWLIAVIQSEMKLAGEINYIFCDDDYLHKLNEEYLGHDTYTDIISFDNGVGNTIHGDIYISIDRVQENAEIYKHDFEQELKRVMVHGILHFCGYKDKTEREQEIMRQKEDEKLEMFHVEQ